MQGYFAYEEDSLSEAESQEPVGWLRVAILAGQSEMLNLQAKPKQSKQTGTSCFQLCVLHSRRRIRRNPCPAMQTPEPRDDRDVLFLSIARCFARSRSSPEGPKPLGPNES